MAQNQRYAQYQGRSNQGSSGSQEGSMMEETYHQTEELVRRNPGNTALITLGVGFGLGLLLTSLLTQRRQNWYDAYTPDFSSMHMPSTREIGNAFSNMWPHSLSRHSARSWF